MVLRPRTGRLGDGGFQKDRYILFSDVGAAGGDDVRWPAGVW